MCRICNGTKMSGACTEVSPQCPVEVTTLGYYPNKPLNILIAAAFGVAAVITLGFGIWGRTWGFTGFIVAGCVLELAGRWNISSCGWFYGTSMTG